MVGSEKFRILHLQERGKILQYDELLCKAPAIRVLAPTGYSTDLVLELAIPDLCPSIRKCSGCAKS